MTSEALYVDLAENEVITIALLANKSLPVDVFATLVGVLVAQKEYAALVRDALPGVWPVPRR